MKTYVNTKTCTQKSITALFVAAKLWKEPKCPPTGKWFKQTSGQQYHGIPLSNKKEQAIDTENNLNESLKNYAE